MKLFTGGIDKKLFAQFPKGSDLKNQKVIAKIFNPFGRGTWYIINSDPNDPDYLWAIVDLYEPEVGSVSRKELESVRIKPFNLKLERDMYFDEVNAQELYDGLLEGKRYAKGGYMADGGVFDDERNLIDIKVGDEVVEYRKRFPNAEGKTQIGSNGRVIKIVDAMAKVSFPNDYEQWIALRDLKKMSNGGYMANGGETEGVDLFEDYEDQPQEVTAILSKYELEDNDYDVLEELLAELEEIGYTFEYGLDGEPYDLRKIGQKGKSEFYAKGGSIKEKADYVSNRNIKSITLTMGGKTMTISGDSILDGVYVKKGTTPSAPRVQPKSVAAKISDLAFDSWEKFDINSGSEIYSSNEIQKKLNKDFKEKGIDEIFSKLDMAQRKKVADILTDNNDHSLRNYLALRGYLGKEERDMYVSLYEERKQRPVNLNPKNFPKVMAEGGRIGFEALSKKVAKRYEGKEVPTKYRSEYGSRYDKEEAKEVGDKVAAKVYRMQLAKK